MVLNTLRRLPLHITCSVYAARSSSPPHLGQHSLSRSLISAWARSVPEFLWARVWGSIQFPGILKRAHPARHSNDRPVPVGAGVAVAAGVVMYVPAPTTAVYGANQGGYFVTERYCGIISMLSEPRDGLCSHSK